MRSGLRHGDGDAEHETYNEYERKTARLCDARAGQAAYLRHARLRAEGEEAHADYEQYGAEQKSQHEVCCHRHEAQAQHCDYECNWQH